jgi:hypothetical protein
MDNERMFDEEVETHVKLVDGKHVVVTDEETIAQMDASAMAEAVNDFGFRAKKFRDSNGGDPRPLVFRPQHLDMLKPILEQNFRIL